MYLNPTPARPRPPNQNHRVDVDPDRPRRETRARGPSFASADADVVDGVVAARAQLKPPRLPKSPAARKLSLQYFISRTICSAVE